ncbi:MAG: winged helix-turn-helix domain-containing protein [Bacillota bacterium]|uniref:Molybdate transport system regulatory protein n=2 Tax=Carboxydocella TaxID=178898 RepID=A0A1T4NKQ8_9FIRM|nr:MULTISPECIES: LysR family transcriptional regulator [Carboxydocella]AVX20081.1 molybdate transport system regulatory protein [Carboxydocella thermautotrophica]AVX30498.1 molybdate transport system regulatory protein [Carboxydocella thermautotrophica]GAW27843.1 ModE family transcriptional regulator [Carboxydocella sp. ULO1]SJZ79666.1 molybdate transport system regulatory protein [Carboxydocella sporoproducens DSM 16521]
MEVRWKAWLVYDDKAVGGSGLCALLKAIQQYGSLNQAAQKLGISYRQAWGRLRKAEAVLQRELVYKQTGGENGGGMSLTGDGERLLLFFEQMTAEINAVVSYWQQRKPF